MSDPPGLKPRPASLQAAAPSNWLPLHGRAGLSINCMQCTMSAGYCRRAAKIQSNKQLHDSWIVMGEAQLLYKIASACTTRSKPSSRDRRFNLKQTQSQGQQKKDGVLQFMICS